MLTPSPAAAAAPGPSVGRIIGGFALMAAWVGAHVVLFYLFFLSGFLVELALAFVKAIFLPGATRIPAGETPAQDWSDFLLVGLSLAGAAGIPLGLRIFWRRRRRVLMGLFWFGLFVGFCFEVFSFYRLVATAFTFPS